MKNKKNNQNIAKKAKNGFEQMFTLGLFVVTFVKKVLNCHWRILYALNIETLRNKFNIGTTLTICNAQHKTKCCWATKDFCKAVYICFPIS